MSDLQEPLKKSLRYPVTPQRLDAMWQTIENRRRAPAAPTRSASSWALGLATLMILLGSVTWLVVSSGRGSPRMQLAAAGPLVRADGVALAQLDAPSAGLLLTLSDRSRIELAPGARLVPHASNGSLFATELVTGRALFDVTPHGPRRWVIDAGDVQVQVLGTRFTVERRGESVRVQVDRGLVRVSGPRVPGGVVQLAAAQGVSIDAKASSPEASAVEPPSGAPAGAADGGGIAPGLEPPTAEFDAARVRFERAVAAHDPAHAFAALGARGFARAVASARSVDELLTLSDVARATGHARQAALALTRIVDDHATDARASLAALTLGRLQLEQLGAPLPAARALARAIELGLPQGLAEDGQARLVEAYARAGQLDLARRAADSYRARFPQGHRRVAVEAWVGAHNP